MIKKISAIFLALMLCIACVPMTVGAQTDMVTTGTKITSLSDISDLAGEYYLEAPITVSQTLAGTFTGTLHGNGQTITTSTTLFNALGEGAVIENLNIEGAVTCSDTLTTKTNVYHGVLANKITANADITKVTEIKNVTNNAKLTVNLTTTYNDRSNAYVGLVAYANTEVKFDGVINNGAILVDELSATKGSNINGLGGILGYSEGDGAAPLTFLNCKNTANITVDSDATTDTQRIVTALVGGISGQTTSKNVSVSYKNCENSGTIEAKNVSGNAAGFKFGGITGVANQGTATYTFENCINNGEILTKSQGGGMVADIAGSATYKNCVNNANITMISTTNAQQIYMGGIAGRHNSTVGTFIGCINYGALSSAYGSNANIAVGGMLGYANGTQKRTFERCVNFGDIVTQRFAGGICADNRGNADYIDCTNFGSISKSETAYGTSNAAAIGGIAGQNYNANAVTVSFARCSNFGDISYNKDAANSYAAGISGNSVNNTSFVDCANYATVSSTQYAGGIIGKYTNVKGTFTRCMNFGSVTGTVLDGAIIGNVNKDNATSDKVVLTDCYSVQENAVGTTQAPSAQKGNVSYVYNGQTVADINSTTEGDATAYNTFFNENGKKTVAELSGDAVVANTALSFGDTWTVLEGHPMLNSAFAATYEKTADTSDMEFIGFQVSKEITDGKYSVRFVSQISEALAKNIDKVGFTVTYIQSGSRSVKEITVSDTKVYTSINANVDGKLDKMTADEGCYFVALTVNGVDAAAIDSFIVTPFTVTDETTTNCEAYVCKVEKGVGNEQIKPYSYDFKYTKAEENN